MWNPTTHGRRGGRDLALSVAVLLLAALAVARPAGAEPPTPTPPPSAAADTATANPDAAAKDDVAALRAEMEALRHDYEARMADLERRLAHLESAAEPSTTGTAEGTAQATAAPPAAATSTAPGATSTPPEAGDELAALRAAAASAAGGLEPAPPVASAETAAAAGHERNLSLLNPEISATGIFLGSASNADREQFDAHEFELDVQSALDPFSRMRLTLSFNDQGVDVEEGWVDYASLPGGLDLLAGRFRQRFGALNRQHLHALPQVDYPLALRTYFGDEGLAQTGLSLSWLLPHPFATANELTLEVTDGDSEAFAGQDFQQLSVLGHLKNFWELSDASYLEWGLSGITGEGPLGGERNVFGSDLTFNWRPPGRAKYRDLTWRSEALLSQRQDPLTGVTHDAWGGYTYLEGLVAVNLSLGVRLDGVENPDDPDLFTWSVVPYVTWWQSEYVRLRGELRHTENDALADPVNEVLLQLTWAAGPHKHETY